MVVGIVGSAVTALLVAMFIVIRAKNGACIAGLMAKTIASFAFVMTAIFGLMAVKDLEISNFVLIVLGLLCGLIGDIILELKVIYKNDSSSYLPYGMIAFGFGHVFYFSAISFFAKDAGIDTVLPMVIAAGAGIVLTAVTLVMASKVMKLEFGDFFPHTMFYTFILTFVSVFALIIGLSIPFILIMALGLILILVSDLILSMQYFGGKEDSKILHILNHSIYYLGQIAIVVFIYCFAIL